MGKKLISSILATVLAVCLCVPTFATTSVEEVAKADAITYRGVVYQVMSYSDIYNASFAEYDYQCDSDRFLALVKLINYYGYEEYQVPFEWANTIDGSLYIMAGFTVPGRQEIYFSPDTDFATEIHETSHAIYDLFGYPSDLVQLVMDNQVYSDEIAYHYGDRDEAMADALADYFLGRDTEEVHNKMDKYIQTLVNKSARLR